jgi:putative ATP-binding cassette transporter
MMQLDRRAWSQFLALARPYWVCERKWTPWGLTALLIALLLTYTHFSVVFNDLLGDFASALADRDGDRFWAGMRLFLVLLILAVPVNAFYYFVRDKLALLWRQWMTSQFLGGYLQNRAYYGLAAHPSIDNPDQRVAEDINIFTQRTLKFLLILANGIMQLVAYSAVLWCHSRVLVAFLVLYALAGTAVTLLAFGKGMTVLNYLQLQHEANFRFSLVRIRENAEAIAFYRGESEERAHVEHRFGQAFLTAGRLIWWQLFLNMFQYANSYAAYLLPYAILAPAILAGELEVGTVIKASGAFSYCLAALNLVIDNFDGLSKFAAGIDRLDSFQKALQEAGAAAPGREAIRQRVGDELRLERVTLRLPHSDRVVVKDLSLQLPPETNLVITGASGCGKTSLLRAVVGLWDRGHGTITRPRFEDVLFLPQRPYLAPGSLRSQLLYPRAAGARTDEDMLRALDLVQLAHLKDGAEPLAAEADWGKVLSIGEQQRLSFARLLLVRPRYAFLDEATSALDPSNEANLYRLVSALGITVVSISHHAAVRKYHKLELELLGQGLWRLRRVRDADQVIALPARPGAAWYETAALKEAELEVPHGGMRGQSAHALTHESLYH